MTLRRPHDCRRCGATIRPGEVFTAVDALDADGELRVLLCADCGRALRRFVDGEAIEAAAEPEPPGDGDGGPDG